MTVPNFFILGAPKCGTSTLTECLRHHPNVFFSTPKELGFFNSRSPALVEDFRTISGLDEYLEYFAGAEERHLAVGEGTVHYLSSETAVQDILDLNPDARLIAMVRNPVELVYSFHGHLVHAVKEDTADFEEAWRKQNERSRGRSVPRFCVDRSMLMYSELGMLGAQLERVFALAPAGQVKVVVFDDLVRDPRGAYQDVLAFLDLPGDGRTEFPRIHASERVRSRLLSRGVGYGVRNTLRMKKALGIRGGLGLLKWVDRRNIVNRSRPTLSASFEAELREHFREDVDLLSQLLGRDLSPWHRGESAAANALKRTR